MKAPTEPLQSNIILIPVNDSSQPEEAVQSVQALSLPKRVLLLHTISIPKLAYPGTGMNVGHNFFEAAVKGLRAGSFRILKKTASLLPREWVSYDRSPPPCSILLIREPPPHAPA